MNIPSSQKIYYFIDENINSIISSVLRNRIFDCFVDLLRLASLGAFRFYVNDIRKAGMRRVADTRGSRDFMKLDFFLSCEIRDLAAPEPHPIIIHLRLNSSRQRLGQQCFSGGQHFEFVLRGQVRGLMLFVGKRGGLTTVKCEACGTLLDIHYINITHRQK